MTLGELFAILEGINRQHGETVIEGAPLREVQEPAAADEFAPTPRLPHAQPQVDPRLPYRDD